MSSYAENWIPYADSLQQDAVEEVPHLDMTVQRGSDQLIRVVWIQNGRRYGVCMASNISFRRQCRYNDPRSGRIYFHAGANDGEKITKGCASGQRVDSTQTKHRSHTSHPS